MTQGMGQSHERWTYDVFLSFRGPDVRKSFLSHLYSGFIGQGLKTFKDDEELERGGSISQQILEAIETSNVLVVVLSKDYASSSWCLDELVHIMKAHKSNDSQLVFPIFYNANPSDIRRQKGSYAVSFSRHESRYPPNKVKVWREALTEVANISGWDMRSRNEAECIENITSHIREKCGCRYLNVPPYAVGMRSRLRRISVLLSKGSDEVRVIGIYGMGGIGKTTLAKVAFNEFSYLFEGSSFLENFKEKAKKPEGRTHLKHQLLSDILRRDNIKLYGLDHAVKESFRSKTVLIVVDDVDDIDQLESVQIRPDYFGRRSRIIITTRNKRFLDQIEVKERYSPKELDGDESLELFSWHAFRASQPPKEFLQLSEEVVAYCEGLPLAVEVWGRLLIKRSISECESMLERLKRIPDGNIQEKLKISFDELDRLQKDVFLDIACFFIGVDRDYVACILDGYLELNLLMERCLITVSGNKIMMHNLLRDMGREIVREIPSKNCGEHSRLWNLDDVICVLTRKTGTNAVEGLSLESEAEVMDFEVEAFAKMKELRLLQLSKVILHGSYEHLPKDIRWLSWHGFSSESFPTNLSLRSVVALDMQYSNLKRFWKAQAHTQPANKLKHLDLSHSEYLTETPDFSYFPNVEKLLFINCKSLVLVHKSIGILHKKLVLLNLSSCIELDTLPEELYKLKSLQTLLLTECSKLERLDDALGELESLTTLNADFTALGELPPSINQLKKLKKLSVIGCKGSLSDDQTASLFLPISLSGLTNLHTLNIALCNLSDDMIPKDIESLSLLRRLDLAGNNFRNLPTDFAKLTNLHGLKLHDCAQLQSIFSLPRSLVVLVGRNCISLQRIPDLSECTAMTTLDLSDCPNLVETPGINNLQRLRIYSERCYLGPSNTRIPNNKDQSMLKDWLQRNHNHIYLPEYDLPNWVNFQGEMHSFSFTVPETHNSDPAVGFTMWTEFVCQGEEPMPRSIRVKNLTRGGTWIHMIVKAEPEIINFINDFRVEPGDHMEVDVCCDDYFSILKTGFAFAYKSRDSSNCDIQIPPESDVIYYGGDRSTLRCLRPNFETDPFQAVVHDMRVVGGVVSEIYAYSMFPDISGKKNPPAVEESDDIPRRKMRPGLKKILGAIGFLTLGVVLGKHGKPLRLIQRRPVDEKDGEKD